MAGSRWNPNDQSLMLGSGKGTTFHDMREADWMSLEASGHTPGAPCVPGPSPPPRLLMCLPHPHATGRSVPLGVGYYLVLLPCGLF